MEIINTLLQKSKVSTIHLLDYAIGIVKDSGKIMLKEQK